MRAIEFLLEAKPDNLGQGLLDKIFATYQKRDINDQTIPKFSDGLGIANYMFKYSGPQKLIWTAKQYTIDQHFFLHDLENWKNIFDLFDRQDIKQRLERKDINQYKSINDLKSVIQPLVQQRENMTEFDHILEAVDKFVKKGEAEWLYRGSEYSIYHPRTFYSSNVLLNLYGGENQVDVCTVTGKNYFTDHYSPNGYLIYTLTPDNFFVAYINQKPAHLYQSVSEFSDKLNDHTSFTFETQLTMFPELKPIIQRVANEHTQPSGIWLIVNRDIQTEENVIPFIKNSGANIRLVRPEIITHEMCMIASKHNIHSILKYIPKEFIDQELCNSEFEKNVYHITKIPREFITKEMCEAAVKKQPKLITHVPREFATIDLWKYCIGKEYELLKSMPKVLKTYQFCYDIVSNYGWALNAIPEQFKNLEMCKAAIRDAPGIITRLPSKYRTEDMYILACQHDDNILTAIPYEKRTYNVCMTAIKNGNPLYPVPGNILDEKMCLAAVTNDSWNIRTIPNEMKTYEVCLAAAKSDADNEKKYIWPYIPEKFKDKILRDLKNENT